MGFRNVVDYLNGGELLEVRNLQRSAHLGGCHDHEHVARVLYHVSPIRRLLSSDRIFIKDLEER